MVRIKRSYPEPASLAIEKEKANGTYRTDEVLKTLSADFFNKCYICEYKNPNSINVEHLKSHRGDKKLKFSWENLFWSCFHCNNIKLGDYDDILDCTKEDVEDCIRYKMDLFPMAEVKVTALNDNNKVEKTVELLNKVYNGTIPLKKIESKYIRDELLDELMKLQELILRYIDDELEQDEKESAKRMIRKHLSSKAAFAAFKRWIIKDNHELLREFGDCMDSK